MDRRLGGESNWEIVSFRSFVRVRARGLFVEWEFTANVPGDISLFPFRPPHFSFFPSRIGDFSFYLR